jgi:hypothetical protein
MESHILSDRVKMTFERGQFSKKTRFIATNEKRPVYLTQWANTGAKVRVLRNCSCWKTRTPLDLQILYLYPIHLALLLSGLRGNTFTRETAPKERHSRASEGQPNR